MRAKETFNWDAIQFFGDLCRKNKLAKNEGFVFAVVAGLEGFEDALQIMQEAVAILAVSDSSDGYTEINTTPHTRRIKTVFMAIRHAYGDSQQREKCLETMREVFRQFMSRLILEKTRLEQNRVYIDPRISFREMEQYFFNGAACAFFQVATDNSTDLRFNEDEWDE